MKLQSTLFFSLLLWVQPLLAQQTPVSVIKQALQKTEQTKVFSYEFTVYFKSIGEVNMPKPWKGVAYVAPDTFICKYTSWSGRVCDYYSIRIGDSSVRYFIKPDKEQYDWVKTNNEQFAPHSGFNCFSSLAKFDKPSYYIRDAEFFAQADTLLNGINCSVIRCVEKQSDLSNWAESRFYISKTDSFLLGFESFFGFGDADTIYKGCFFNDIKVNERFDYKELNNKLSSFKDITFDTSLNPPFVTAKAIGDSIASFVVTDLFSDTKINIDTKGKVILLDFWYMACYGCILSYPTINKLHQDFANNNSVEIYSVNPFDLEDKQREKLKNYVKKYQMESNLVKMEEKQFDYFRKNAYPTFYVIVDGVIMAIKIGSYDDLYKELKTLIKDGLKQVESNSGQ